MVYIPVLSAAVSVALFLWVAHKVLLGNKAELGAEARLPGQLLMLVLTKRNRPKNLRNYTMNTLH